MRSQPHTHRTCTDKRVDADQFAAAMKQLGFTRLPWQQVFKKFDIDGSGYLDWREFLLGLNKLRASDNDTLEMLFSVYDIGTTTVPCRLLAATLALFTLTPGHQYRRHWWHLAGGVCVHSAQHQSLANGQRPRAAAQGCEAVSGCCCMLGETVVLWVDLYGCGGVRFEELDTDDSGKITLEQFKAGVEGVPELVDAFVRPLQSHIQRKSR